MSDRLLLLTALLKVTFIKESIECMQSFFQGQLYTFTSSQSSTVVDLLWLYIIIYRNLYWGKNV